MAIVYKQYSLCALWDVFHLFPESIVGGLADIHTYITSNYLLNI